MLPRAKRFPTSGNLSFCKIFPVVTARDKGCARLRPRTVRQPCLCAAESKGLRPLLAHPHLPPPRPAPTAQLRAPQRWGQWPPGHRGKLRTAIEPARSRRPGLPSPRSTSAGFSPGRLWAGLVTRRGQRSATETNEAGVGEGEGRSLGRPEQQQVAHEPWPLSPLDPMPRVWSSKALPEGSHPILHTLCRQVGGPLRPIGMDGSGRFPQGAAQIPVPTPRGPALPLTALARRVIPTPQRHASSGPAVQSRDGLCRGHGAGSLGCVLGRVGRGAAPEGAWEAAGGLHRAGPGAGSLEPELQLRGRGAHSYGPRG